MSKFVWRIFLCLLSSPGLFVYVLHQVVIPCTCCFVGDVMAGLLTPKEQVTAASVSFGPRHPGLMAPGPNEYRMFLLYSSFALLLLPISDQPSNLSCCCFFYAGSSNTSILGWEECYLGVFWDVGGGLLLLVCLSWDLLFSPYCFVFVCSSLNISLQTASEGHGFLPTSPCSSRTPELGSSSAVCLFWCMFAFRLVFVSIANRLGLLLL